MDMTDDIHTEIVPTKNGTNVSVVFPDTPPPLKTEWTIEEILAKKAEDHDYAELWIDLGEGRPTYVLNLIHRDNRLLLDLYLAEQEEWQARNGEEYGHCILSADVKDEGWRNARVSVNYPEPVGAVGDDE